MINLKLALKTVCSTVVLSNLLYAGGDIRLVVPEDAFIMPEVEVIIEDTPFYVGAGLGGSSVTSHLFGADGTFSGVFRLGYDYNDYIGIEARGSYGLCSQDQLGHDYSYGLYLKPQYPISEAWNAYGLLGYAQTKISFEDQVAFNGNTNDSTTQSDFSFGAGVDYQLNNNWSLFADAVQYIDESTTGPEGTIASRVDAVTFGSAFHF